VTVVAYPNPFFHTTTVSYRLPTAANISLNIYDVTGRIVKTLVNEEKEGGKHKVRFDASGLATGIYFAELCVGKERQARKLILMH
jgi:hypothetical protein